jgi:hypothetical protein
MKIVNLKQLCEETDGTLFACIKEDSDINFALPMQIKFDTFKYSDDSFHFNGLACLNPMPIPTNNQISNGEIFYYDGTDYDFRDDGHNKFVVYNKSEIKMIISALNDALEEQDKYDAEKVYKCNVNK